MIRQLFLVIIAFTVSVLFRLPSSYLNEGKGLSLLVSSRNIR